MGTEGRKESTSAVNNARYPSLHNGAEGSAALQLCHSGTLWQNALLQLAGAPEGDTARGPSPWGLTPRDIPSPRTQGWDAGG